MNQYHKEWRNRNYEYYKKYQAQYRKENKDKFNKKFICECGSNIIKKNRKTHYKSFKHRLYTELKEWRNLKV